MICRRPPSLTDAWRQKPPAHIWCSASHLSWFSLSAGRKDGDFVFCSFQAKNKKVFHIHFCEPELTRAPNLLINSVKLPPPHSSPCCVILNNVTFLCCFKWAIVRFWEKSERCLMLHRPLWFVFSQNQATGGAWNRWMRLWKCLFLVCVQGVQSWRLKPYAKDTF